MDPPQRRAMSKSRTGGNVLTGSTIATNASSTNERPSVTTSKTGGNVFTGRPIETIPPPRNDRPSVTTSRTGANVLSARPRTASTTVSGRTTRLVSARSTTTIRSEQFIANENHTDNSGINGIISDIESISLSAVDNHSIADGGQVQQQRSLPSDVIYRLQLLDNDAYYQSSDGKIVAMADWDPLQRRIKSTYCIISGFEVTSGSDQSNQLLQCTCNEAMERRHHLENMKAVGVVVSTVDQQAIRSHYCIHARVISHLRLVITNDDDHDEDDVNHDDILDDDVFEQMSTTTWLVKDAATKSFGVIRRSRNGRTVSCRVCNKARCAHVIHFDQNFERLGFELPEDFDPSVLAKVISRRAIPMDGYILQRCDFPIKGALVPDADGVCSDHGHAWANSCPIAEGWIASKSCKIFNADGVEYGGGAVYYRRTSGSCDCKLYLDGGDRGLININNSALVEYSLMFRYVSFYSRNGLTLRGFYDNILEFNKWSGKAASTISYDRLYTAWNAFVSLGKAEVDHFICRQCGPFPETIVLDGTALSCAKRNIPSSVVDQRNRDNLRTLFGTEQKERVFVRQAKARKLLMQFATGKIGNTDAQLDRASMDELLQRLDHDRPGDNPLLNLVREISNNGARLVAPEAYRKLLRELAKNTPMCAALQVGTDDESIEILRQVVAGAIDIGSSTRENMDMMDVLHRKVPAIMEALMPIRKAEHQLPATVRLVLDAMIEVVSAMYANCGARSNDDYTQIDDVNQSLAYFPHWPIVNGLGKYDDLAKGNRDEADVCTKYRHGHKVLGPGIVTYLCPHGVCYGFAVMDSYESPRMPFEVFATRITPTNVIYDNACKLHLYCLKREPRKFQNTRFFVDRFHWFNHSACSIGYDIKRYKTDGGLSAINSQACEQLNSRLVKLKSSLSYMTFEKFMSSLVMFLSFRNRSLGV